MDQEKPESPHQIKGIRSLIKGEDAYNIVYSTGEFGRMYILNTHVFRYYISTTGIFLDYPVPNNPEDIAHINSKSVSDYGNKAFEQSTVEENDDIYAIHTTKISISFDKIKGTISVFDKRTKKVVFVEKEFILCTKGTVTQSLIQQEDEYFFGGGMQNGRFTHKNELIKIVNSNNWVDGGVTSPNPFYWSTYGFGVMRNTWQPGVYDFGSTHGDVQTTTHEEDYFDAYFFINSEPKDILNDYYELTGKPLLMPEFAFYEAHLNAFNRDYWVLVDPYTPKAIKFEDGKYYKCYQPTDIGDKKGILESLNGEKNNYQFSARAMIDRYKRHDLPLGWFIPNDGYGCGYGQSDSLDGDIENLKNFGDYARSNGIEVSLWTESNLEPKNPDQPKKGERDLRKEVGSAGVVALKCDVAWVGSGYSYGLTAVEHAADIFVDVSKHKVRPMIITVDGWAGTQRCAGVWSGDQKGGEWEYIRFHIPTYIGAGLSGQPIVGSDMDGIYAGKEKNVNIRDYQWKAFTPLQLNMDGWGNIPKTPFTFDEEATNINRAYLKLKSMLMPYNYSIGYYSITGLPMVRAMLLEFSNEKLAYTKDSQYQFMWGPNILVAPVYTENDLVRNAVYLPGSTQIWIDFFTGKKYQGGKLYNNIETPLWKIPVFVKDGSIIPFTNPNNNPREILRSNRIFTIYPNGENEFEVFEDDGISSGYLEGFYATTTITSNGPKSNEKGDLVINIKKTKGSYSNLVKDRTTIIQIMASEDIDYIKACFNRKAINITKVDFDEYDFKENVYCFIENFTINPYLRKVGDKSLNQKFLLIKLVKADVTETDIHLRIKDFANIDKVFGSNNYINENLDIPDILDILEVTPTSISLEWTKVNEAIYYEVERDGAIFSNIKDSVATFVDFKYESDHKFRIRSANDSGVSQWSDVINVKTAEDPHKYTVKGVKVVSNIPCQSGQEVHKLTDGDKSCMWHTNWDHIGKADVQAKKYIKLTFDLGDVYELEKFEYLPRDDAGNGTFLTIQYRYSKNGNDWSEKSNAISWPLDAAPKSIDLNGASVKIFEITIIDSLGDYGSGRQVYFYNKRNK